MEVEEKISSETIIIPRIEGNEILLLSSSSSEGGTLMIIELIILIAEKKNYRGWKEGE